MALNKKINVVLKIVGPVQVNSYIRIESLSGSKEEMDVKVCVYSAKDMEFIKTEYVRFVPSVAHSSENFIKQAYEHLKTLPKFAGAADV